MKKSRFYCWVTAAVAIVSMLSTTGCVTGGWVDTGLASLNLSTNSIVFDLDGGAEKVYIAANRDWQVSIPAADEGWLSVDYTSGTGSKNIVLSTSASAASRYSDVTVRLYNSMGTIYSKTISITQGTVVDETTLAYAARAENAGKTYSGLSGTVVAVTSVSYVVADDTGGILIYAGGTPPFSAGDVVEIAGTTVAYGGLSQFSNDATVTKVGEATVDYSNPQVMSGTDLDALIAGTPTVKFIKLTGTLSVSGNYVNITDIDGATSARGSLAYAPSGLYDSALAGQVVDVYGYLVGVTGTVYVNVAGVCVVAAGADFELPDLDNYVPDVDVPDSDDLPQYELTGAIAASDFVNTDATDAPSAVFGNYMFVWSQGTNNSLAPKYYVSGDAIRMYINNTLTVATVDGTPIESIDFSLLSGYDHLTCDVGVITNGRWTGSANQVTFTSTATSSRITSIVVDGVEGEPEALPENFFEFSDLPTSATASDLQYTINGVEFVVNNVSYSTSHKNATIYEGGYICNSAAIDAEFVTIIVNYSGLGRAELYAGTEPSTMVEMTTKLTTGNSVAYSVPVGTTYFKLAKSSGSCYVASIELSAEPIQGEDAQEDQEPDDVVGTHLVISAQSILDVLGKTTDDFVSSAVNLTGETIAMSGVTITSYKTGSGTDFRLYMSNDVMTIRPYNGNVITFTATGGKNITSIRFETSSSGTFTELNGAGEVSGAIWSGDAAEVTLSFTATTISSLITVLFAE